MTRRQWLGLALAAALLALAAAFAVDGWYREAVPIGFAGIFVQIVWAAAVVVDRIERTPPLIVPSSLDQYDEGPRYYGG